MSTESPEFPRGPARGSPDYSAYAAGDMRRNEIRQREQRRRAGAGAVYADPHRTAQALAWLSVGLGATAVLMPRLVGRLSGVGSRTGLLRTIGARELASGAGLFSARDATPWLWSRVLGDTMDLMVLGAAAVNPAVGTRMRPLVSLGLVAGIAAADVAASVRQTRQRTRGGVRAGEAEDYLECSVIINKSPQECYQYWRTLTNAPNFMGAIDSVTEIDERRSHWVAQMPGGARLEWDSRISEDQPGERIAWHSEANAPLRHAGVVSFERAPGDRGTLVRLTVHYRPPAGRSGRRAAQWFGKGSQAKIKEDLRRFKQILEAGEIATTRGQPSGRRSVMARMVGAGRGA
ncbi:MAG TPA: SRPBCC family protein [Steroidobacteraceae bacterium]|nr:SRPBCC family protein [Steroidobacteraceae bacterium]